MIFIACVFMAVAKMLNEQWLILRFIHSHIKAWEWISGGSSIFLLFYSYDDFFGQFFILMKQWCDNQADDSQNIN